MTAVHQRPIGSHPAPSDRMPPFDEFLLPPLVPPWMARFTLMAVAVAVSLVVALIAAVTVDATPGTGPLTLAASGRVVVEASGESIVVDSGQRHIPWGATIEIVSGTATLDLPGGGTVELREGFGLATDSRIVVERDLIRVLGGEILAIGNTPAVEAGPARVLVEGSTARIERGLSGSAGLYDGAARVVSGGQSIELSALRQVTVAADGLVPARPAPLSIDAADPWDRRFLADAVDVGAVLETRARGLSAQLRPGVDIDADLLRRVVPALADRPIPAAVLDADRSPGETLIGAAVAAIGDRETIELRWRRAFSFRDAGADWGLVALDVGADPAAVLASVDQAVRLAPTVDVPSTAGGTQSTSSSSAPPAPVASPSAPPTTSPTTGRTVRPSPAGKPAPEPEPEPEPSEPSLPDPDDPPGGLLGGLLDPLLPGGDSSDPAADDGGLLGGLLNGGQSGDGGLGGLLRGLL